MKKSWLADALLKEAKADAASSGRPSKPSPKTSYVAPARIAKNRKAQIA